MFNKIAYVILSWEVKFHKVSDLKKNKDIQTWSMFRYNHYKFCLPDGTAGGAFPWPSPESS